MLVVVPCWQCRFYSLKVTFPLPLYLGPLTYRGLSHRFIWSRNTQFYYSLHKEI
ncbi:hypothetical protein BABINDRAFT_141447 [Babjeviella inositovora NRRL Y-12698]|uniref:Uncharacterized protein n=1 Tax=Babjeviella inositovora NRRL Y-12698 TaxID=984486 RepID=A0A1E3QPF1_9ASCO|nr:uncharacterized protein BABINDRAFT_141447 [Babjeviella inositovora NRRL Y-12698]ODQ79334.1 hypothetical protein BABINDRAFT_141447 [Babjeviella inositovora NRRL Y-12698]